MKGRLFVYMAKRTMKGVSREAGRYFFFVQESYFLLRQLSLPILFDILDSLADTKGRAQEPANSMVC